MNILVCGSRSFVDKRLMRITGKKYFKRDDVLICGMAQGADLIAYNWAIKNRITVNEYPANWSKYKKSAGMIRNREMINVADFVIAFWDGESKGTANTISLAKKKQINCVVINY